MRRSSFTPKADADLVAIHTHINDQDPATAALVVDRIQATIERLCIFPQIGKETKRTGTWVFGGSGKSPFRITYRFDNDTVTVLRVFRAQRQHIQF